MSDPSIVCETHEDRVILQNARLRLVFHRLGDRWTHHLAIPAAGSSFTELVSVVESDPARDDRSRVVSPVYQELHYHETSEEGQNGHCLLVTGLLHDHHFSAAVTFRSDASGAATVEFDVADRCRSPVHSFASTYLLRLGSSSLVDANTELITWSVPEVLDPNRLEITCAPPTSLALAEAGRSATRARAVATIDPSVYTHRLRYCWRTS